MPPSPPRRERRPRSTTRRARLRCAWMQGAPRRRRARTRPGSRRSPASRSTSWCAAPSPHSSSRRSSWRRSSWTCWSWTRPSSMRRSSMHSSSGRAASPQRIPPPTTSTSRTSKKPMPEASPSRPSSRTRRAATVPAQGAGWTSGPDRARRYPPDRRTPPCRCLRESRRQVLIAKRKSPRQPTNQHAPHAGERLHPRAAAASCGRAGLSGNWASHHDRATASGSTRHPQTASGIL